MRITEAEARDIFAKAATEAGISATPAQLDKAAGFFFGMEKALTLLKYTGLAAIVALALAAAWCVFR